MEKVVKEEGKCFKKKGYNVDGGLRAKGSHKRNSDPILRTVEEGKMVKGAGFGTEKYWCNDDWLVVRRFLLLVCLAV